MLSDNGMYRDVVEQDLFLIIFLAIYNPASIVVPVSKVMPTMKTESDSVLYIWNDYYNIML